jgi:hypothetical protein
MHVVSHVYSLDKTFPIIPIYFISSTKSLSKSHVLVIVHVIGPNSLTTLKLLL